MLLIFLGPFAACGTPTAEDLVGSWQVSYNNWKLTLVLNKDSTFEQLFQKKGETNIVRRGGKWELTDFEGPSILLSDALIVRDDAGTIDSGLSADKNNGWVLHVNRTFGHLSLTVNEDLGLYFEKSRQ